MNREKLRRRIQAAHPYLTPEALERAVDAELAAREAKDGAFAGKRRKRKGRGRVRPRIAPLRNRVRFWRGRP